ncbi:protein phosphatase 1 regulatory subunit 12B isoform X2 [Drosophila biarmipes]|uniref:protein phosphatase 1 regulatory subunit 12B isoform X2 n=1 Tax=Drosophila biarmipes TaxID=125945 RepID=UPI0021CCC113|nr:protein phosphatase 1 regulatory subunit 12B isoform X2 [Drosophila biarmipes]
MSSLDARNNSAMMKRAEQLKRWEESDTNRAAPTPRHEHGRRIKFSSGCVFLAACLSGDKDEVVQLLDQGADINTANVDGLTALHQACIDDNLDMVEFLVERGADINRQDNEGWTPLHATASCGFVSIARYLVENGADVAAVNSDGDLALDLAIDVQHMAMIDYMEKMVQELNINVDEARKAEEQAMLNDAKKWLRSDAAEVDRPHPKTGATALHVAAAKGYTKVLGLLLAGRGNVDRQDNDGWTPLHAASHWGQRETAEMLVESLADMDIRNYAGQSCIDVADRKIVKFLEELRANKRNKRRPSSQIRISDTIENHVDKTPTKLVRVEVRTDATKDAENVKPNQQIHAAEHPVEEEAPWRRKLPRTPNDSPTNNQVPDRELSSNSSETANDVILRRTQSFENDQKFYQKYNELRARIKANSCPILPANANANAAAANNSNNNNNLSSNNNHNNNNNNNKSDLLLGYAAGTTTMTTSTSTSTTTTVSTFNNTHSNTNNTSTPQQLQQPAAAASATNQLYSVQRSASLKDNSMYYRKPNVTIATPASAAAPANSALNSPSTVQTPPIRSQVTAKLSEKSNNGSSSTASVSDVESSKPPPKQSAGNIIKNFFKSFVPPVRDEESETQRKAHAKRVRETRRSTQGVTLDEIKSAEELVKKKNMGMANNNNNNNISTTTTNTISNSGNETSSASSTSTSAPTSSILDSNEQRDESQPPPPPTTPPPAIIPTTTTATDETEIEEVVTHPPPAVQSLNDTTASFTLSAPVRRSFSGEADANSDPEGDQDQSMVSASYTIMPRRERLPESTENAESTTTPQKTDPVAKSSSEEKAEEPPHARPTDLPLIPAPAASTEAIKSSSAATTPAALESPVRLRDKRSLTGSQESETKSDTASPVTSHPDFNARDSLLSLYARRTTESGAGGAGGGAGGASGTASSSSTSAAERRPSWRLKFDAGSKFKLEDITSGGTYPPNNSTIIPSAPAVMAAVNLSTTTGVQRRISSGPNALNASNQSLNSVGRPVSAPSEGTNNSAYVSPSARKYEANATATAANSTAAASTNSTSNSVSATSANHATATATNATSNHDDKDNDKENDNRTQTVIQRRRKPKRRSTGVVHIDMDELDPERQNESSNNDNEEKEKESGSERTSRSRLGSTASTATTSESKSSSSNDKAENGDGIDYKALYEAAKLENDKLKQIIKQKDDEAVQTRATLERFANATTKNSLSELEKRERRAMERKLSELEEELKLLQKLKTENDRLRAENRALTRVVSKLTTSAQSQLAKTK